MDVLYIPNNIFSIHPSILLFLSYPSQYYSFNPFHHIFFFQSFLAHILLSILSISILLFQSFLAHILLSILSNPILLFQSFLAHILLSILFIPILPFLFYQSQYYPAYPIHPNTTLPILSITAPPFISYPSQYYPL